jgi:site-specific DNA-methyltransferase (adenine-specific)
MISWVKPNFRTISWKNRTENSSLRTWFNIQEYCLYYTFEDSGTGLNALQPLYFSKYLAYMTEQKKILNWKINDFNNFLGYKSIASHWFYSENNIQLQPRFITKKDYEKLQTTGFFQKPYEELRAEYEELRPRFNIQNGHDYNNVWYSKEDSGNNSSKFHTCEKPQDLLQKIILTSSNENDIVLDCFAGSGSLAQACLEANRNFLCCERDEGYVKIANDRLSKWQEDLLRQDKWLNDRGVMDFESDIKHVIKQGSLL